MNSELSAKGAPHTSLGQRPRTSKQTGSGLKARTIIGAVAMVRAFSPDFFSLVSWGVAPGYYGAGPLALMNPEGITK